jgi:hypothetical protein
MTHFYVIGESKEIHVIAQKEVDISIFYAFLRIKFKRLFYVETRISFLIDTENNKGKIIMLESSSKNAFFLLSLIRAIENLFLSKKIYDMEATLKNKRLKNVIQRFGWAVKRKHPFWGDVYYKRLNKN